VVVPCCTTETRNTHKTYLREIIYAWNGFAIDVFPHMEQSVWRFLNCLVVLVVVHGGRLKNDFSSIGTTHAK
jgi:hypothetical protein